MTRRVVVVGTGRMGSAFSRAFKHSGVPARTLPARALLEHRVRFRRPAGPLTWILAVTDRAVTDTAAALVAREWIARGDVVVHLAGMLGPDALNVARQAGASVGALHPLVAVASPRIPPSLTGAAASFEGERSALRAVRAFARPLGLRVIEVQRVDRARYHAAAALVATGAIALAQGAEDLFALAAQGGRDAAAAFVASLLVSAAHNVRVLGAARALASPLLRGDVAAVAKHLEAMQARPHARALYAAALAQVLESLARTGAVDAQVVDAASRLLGA